MPTAENHVTVFLLNLLFTVFLLFLPFAIYRGIKGEPITPQKARRSVIVYMLVYCIFRIALNIIGMLGTESEATEIVNLTAVVFWAWIDIKILSKGYCVEDMSGQSNNTVTPDIRHSISYANEKPVSNGFGTPMSDLRIKQPEADIVPMAKANDEDAQCEMLVKIIEQRNLRNEDGVSDVIIRMKTDSTFREAVNRINEMPPEKLSSLLALLK